jgi:hypothetical protein
LSVLYGAAIWNAPPPQDKKKKFSRQGHLGTSFNKKLFREIATSRLFKAPQRATIPEVTMPEVEQTDLGTTINQPYGLWKEFMRQAVHQLGVRGPRIPPKDLQTVDDYSPVMKSEMDVNEFCEMVFAYHLRVLWYF